jgi:hypothetical protein
VRRRVGGAVEDVLEDPIAGANHRADTPHDATTRPSIALAMTCSTSGARSLTPTVRQASPRARPPAYQNDDHSIAVVSPRRRRIHR